MPQTTRSVTLFLRKSFRIRCAIDLFAGHFCLFCDVIAVETSRRARTLLIWQEIACNSH
jgi:hypothetical protein